MYHCYSIGPFCSQFLQWDHRYLLCRSPGVRVRKKTCCFCLKTNPPFFWVLLGFIRIYCFFFQFWPYFQLLYEAKIAFLCYLGSFGSSLVPSIDNHSWNIWVIWDYSSHLGVIDVYLPVICDHLGVIWNNCWVIFDHLGVIVANWVSLGTIW